MSEKWKEGQLVDDRYELRRVLGGGMGAVFVCYDRSRERTVALKTFKDRFLFDQRVVKRFSDEAAIWIRLGSHRNIVRAISVQNIAFRPYIVLEYIPGDKRYGLELTGHIPDGGMALETAVDYAKQFCAGMVHAREMASDAEHDFVHADIKPSNIFIQDGGTLKISDFGLSRSYSDQERLIEWGSFAYMSPEQLRGDSIDVRSDIYAFGCVLYQMVVGRRPFRDMHEREVPPRPRAIRRDCPEALDEMIMACLENDPSIRIRDFGALREALAADLHCGGDDVRGSEYSLPGKLDHRETLDKGIGLADLGRSREAIACFDSVLEESSDIEERYIALCGRASSLDALGLADEAATVFDSAIALLPDRPFAYMLRANIDNDAGRLSEALGGYAKALSIDVDYAICYYNRGLCRERLGDLDEALADFSRAIDLGFSEAYTDRGGIYQRLGRLEESLRDYETSISINPRNAIALGNAGSLYFQLGQPDQARSCLDLAIDVNPDYLLPYFFRAELNVSFGRFLEAIADFEQALAIDPERIATDSGLKFTITGAELDRIYPTILHDCAVACLRAGENRKAREYLRRFALKASPSFEERLGPSLQTLARLEGMIGD